MKKVEFKELLSLLAVLLFLILAIHANSQSTVIDNDLLRFGNGSINSVTPTGNLSQPFYYNPTYNLWRKLTYSNYALDNSFATGGDGLQEWNLNGTIISNPILANQFIDKNDFFENGPVTGYGTIISSGTISVNGNDLLVENIYTLPLDKAYIEVTVRLTNLSQTVATNVRTWIGTRDDWVGTTDQPREQKGNIVNGAFVQITNPSERAAAIKISSGDEAVLFYTVSDRGNTIIQRCCSWNNVVSQNPSTSGIDETMDGSYGFYVRMDDLAPGESDDFTWYYAAGTLADISDIIKDVAEVSGAVNNITYTSADFKANSTTNATGYWMVVPRNSAAPTQQQVKNGFDYGSVEVVARGSGAMLANVEQTFHINGLSAGMDYDLYFVSEDDVPQFSDLLKVSFSTQAYTIPEISTIPVSGITKASAWSGGNVLSDGGQPLMAKGICWSTSPNPTVNNSHTINGTETGSFSSALTGLLPNTTYYLKAYATNSIGTQYGNQISFVTLPNHSPIANNDGPYTVNTGEILTANLLTNDNDFDGDDLDVMVQPTLTFGFFNSFDLETGTFEYQAPINWAGSFSFSYTVTDGIASVNGTATIVVNDNLPPEVITSNIIVQLDDTGNSVISTDDVVSSSFDNIGITGMVLDRTTFTCTDIGTNTVALTATDAAGNTTSQTAEVVIEDITPPAVYTQNLQIQLDDTGNASITAEEVDNGSTDACGIASYNLDRTEFSCTDLGTNTVIFTVTDNNGNRSQATALITVTDNIAPVLNAEDSYVLETTAESCRAVANFRFNTADNCSMNGNLAFNGSGYGGLEGWTITENGGNKWKATNGWFVTSYELAVKHQVIDLLAQGYDAATLDGAPEITVSEDYVGIAPKNYNDIYFLNVELRDAAGNKIDEFRSGNLVCSQNIQTLTHSFTNYGEGVRYVFVEHGGKDAEWWAGHYGSKMGNLQVKVDAPHRIPNLPVQQIAGVKMADGFPVGTTHNAYKVMDGAGNTSTAAFDVIVSDNHPPVAQTQDVTIQLDDTGNASITAQEVDNGSTDACGIASLQLSQTQFDCSQVGTHEVILTVTDNNNNVSTATAIVTVEDNVAPVARTQDLIIQLDDSGNASITAEEIDNGSTDNCGIASLQLSQTLFDCSHEGTNEVILTVTDNNNNVSMATAVVTVEDNVAPVVSIRPLTIYLRKDGTYRLNRNNTETITRAGEEEDATTDNCSSYDQLEVSVSPDQFTCEHAGMRVPVMVTVTDASGNTATGETSVWVIDPFAPDARCKDTTLFLDSNGQARLTAADLDAGSSDACGIESTWLDITSFGVSDKGENTVTFFAKDIHGNWSSCVSSVTVRDTLNNTAPVVVNPVADQWLSVAQFLKIPVRPLEIFSDADDDELTIEVAPEDEQASLSWAELGTDTLFFFPGAGDEGCLSIVVRATDPNGAYAADTFSVCIEQQTTDADMLRSNVDVQVYPNPAHDKVTVKLLPAGIYNVELKMTDMNGRLVLHQHYHPGEQIVVNVSDKVAGMYLLRLTTDERQFLKKIIVSHK